MSREFSFQTRRQALERFATEEFDVLVVGGGITGAAVARECVARGLSVALVERRDFSYGTSSRSSKLIHGGLRYLENFEFKLVFEALAERALLLRTAPSMVRPLPFYFPVYEGDRPSKRMLGMGMWLYDLLSLFKTPGFHKSLSRSKFLEEIPGLRSEGLLGGFRYHDASMWDDVLGIEILRSAASQGAAVANYVEATRPIYDPMPSKGESSARLSGFEILDLETRKTARVRARQVVACAGPWTDELGSRLSTEWKPWLAPSKGIHLVFDYNKLPVPGALVMAHPKDGRISFVIPRKDYGQGVVIVGTTDGPAPGDPDRARIEAGDVEYLLDLLSRFFPSLKLTAKDILSTYIGVRPLVSPSAGGTASLQKISREHHIDLGPGGAVVVAGGKYTTHRTMAVEIMDFALKHHPELGERATRRFSTTVPINDRTTHEALERARLHPRSSAVHSKLWERYGAEALEILQIEKEFPPHVQSPAGFPSIEAQLRFAIRSGLVMHLEDFYFRRVPLYLACADHGMSVLDRLVEIWGEELEKTPEQKQLEKQSLLRTIEERRL